jgi:hypothetical protein
MVEYEQLLEEAEELIGSLDTTNPKSFRGSKSNDDGSRWEIKIKSKNNINLENLIDSDIVLRYYDPTSQKWSMIHYHPDESKNGVHDQVDDDGFRQSLIIEKMEPISLSEFIHRYMHWLEAFIKIEQELAS